MKHTSLRIGRSKVFNLYHCTSAEVIRSINKDGLSGSKTIVSPGDVHFGCDVDQVAGYKKHWSSNGYFLFSVPVSCFDYDLLGPDADDLQDILDLQDDDRHWKALSVEESLRLSGQCTYGGTIEPQNLMVIKSNLLRIKNPISLPTLVAEYGYLLPKQKLCVK